MFRTLSLSSLARFVAPSPIRLASPSRSFGTRAHHAPNAFHTRCHLLRFGAFSGGILLALPFYASHVYADNASYNDDNDFHDVTFGALVRSYVVYTMCSIPTLVDSSPRLLQLANFPGIRWIAHTLVRITFFDHVCDSQS